MFYISKKQNSDVILMIKFQLDTFRGMYSKSPHKSYCYQNAKTYYILVTEYPRTPTPQLLHPL